MKPLKFTIELLITTVCLAMVYNLYTKTTHQKTAMETSVSLENAGSVEEAMDIVKTLPVQDGMYERAQEEAAYIMSTGDTSRYEAEMHRNGISN